MADFLAARGRAHRDAGYSRRRCSAHRGSGRAHILTTMVGGYRGVRLSSYIAVPACLLGTAVFNAGFEFVTPYAVRFQCCGPARTSDIHYRSIGNNPPVTYPSATVAFS